MKKNEKNVYFKNKSLIVKLKNKKINYLYPRALSVRINYKIKMFCNLIIFKNKFTFIILLLIFISSCTTPIKLIVKKPEKYDGKKVKVSGKIISSLRLVNIMCFTIKDKSGKICVVTNNFLPIQGGHLVVRGVVDRNYHYEGRSLLVIKEKELKSRKTKSWKPIKDKL